MLFNHLCTLILGICVLLLVHQGSTVGLKYHCHLYDDSDVITPLVIAVVSAQYEHQLETHYENSLFSWSPYKSILQFHKYFSYRPLLCDMSVILHGGLP